jgi:hypothetical protein
MFINFYKSLQKFNKVYILVLYLIIILVNLNYVDSTVAPSGQPSGNPTGQPSGVPSSLPTSQPTQYPVVYTSDIIDITTTGAEFVGPWYINVDSTSNGPMYQADGGHVRLFFKVETAVEGDWFGFSDCLSIGSGSVDVNKLVSNTKLYRTNITGASIEDFEDQIGIETDQISRNLNNMFDTLVVKTFSSNTLDPNIVYGDGVNPFGSLPEFKNSYEITIDSKKVMYVYSNITMNSCAKPRSYSSWYDSYRWVGGLVPREVDRVVIPKGAGVILIPNNITIESLNMSDGLLISYESSCPPGWTADPIGNVGSKCYKLFEDVLPFFEAEASCYNSKLGSIGAHLVQMSGYEELNTVKRMCRGNIGSSARDNGCWIGLRDATGQGSYDWIDTRAVFKDSFRDWRRPSEPNNLTISEGVATPGELCVFLAPWQDDPLIEEQGSWMDFACALKKAYICQIYSPTFRNHFNIMATTSIRGGGFDGGIVNIYGESDIKDFMLSKTAKFIIHHSADGTKLENIRMKDGSVIKFNANVSVNGYIGEFSNPLGSKVMQPVVYLQESKSVSAQKECSLWNLNVCMSYISKTISFNAAVLFKGDIFVEENVNLLFDGGGELSQAFVQVDANASLILGDYGTRMVAYDAFDIDLSHRGEVIGEYLNDTRLENTKMVGVYRLKASSNGGQNVNITRCIDYHATATELQSILQELDLINSRGGVTVRRYGFRNLASGYTHRIEMDAPSASVYPDGPVEISVFCYGIDMCGCAETKVKVQDSTGQFMCPVSGKTSLVDPNACVIPPTIIVSRISSLSYTKTSGDGMITVVNGYHRLPQKSNLVISATAGTGVTCSDQIDWKGLATDGVGKLIFGGTGWVAWDSTILLFRPDWEVARGLITRLEAAPAFNMFAETFSLKGLGSVFTACPHSNMTWGSGIWLGGSIGGRSTLSITDSLVASGSNKALRYGLTMWIKNGSTFDWIQGNLSMANGADIIVEGTFNIKVISSEPTYFGQAQLLGSDLPSSQELLTREPQNQWHGYYDNTIVAELRKGWYNNPICGIDCLKTNQIIIREKGQILVVPNANAIFTVPVNLVGFSQLIVNENAHFEFQSGGTCGNDVIIDISLGTDVELSGGRMYMKATCTIKGAGELLVSAGVHDLSFSIDAHITISGGAMVWPESRGPGSTITFNGGLLINQFGQLDIQPFSTTIIVKKQVHFKDNCNIQFPVTGSAAQPSNFDEGDAPDESPRGNLTATDVMTWEGGTLQGKADFNALGELYLIGGVKYMKALAKLVNFGHAEWWTGDISMADGADFVNRGKVQMGGDGQQFLGSNFIKGTILPVENGGDVFAMDFHSYDMDMGGLDFREYVALRSEFVSVAPEGWTEEVQKTPYIVRGRDGSTR